MRYPPRRREKSGYPLRYKFIRQCVLQLPRCFQRATEWLQTERGGYYPGRARWGFQTVTLACVTVNIPTHFGESTLGASEYKQTQDDRIHKRYKVTTIESRRQYDLPDLIVRNSVSRLNKPIAIIEISLTVWAK